MIFFCGLSIGCKVKHESRRSRNLLQTLASRQVNSDSLDIELSQQLSPGIFQIILCNSYEANDLRLGIGSNEPGNNPAAYEASCAGNDDHGNRYESRGIFATLTANCYHQSSRRYISIFISC